MWPAGCSGGRARPRGEGTPWAAPRHRGEAHLRCRGGWSCRARQSPRSPRRPLPSPRGSSPLPGRPRLPPLLPGNLPKHEGVVSGGEPEGKKTPQWVFPVGKCRMLVPWGLAKGPFPDPPWARGLEEMPCSSAPHGKGNPLPTSPWGPSSPCRAGGWFIEPPTLLRGVPRGMPSSPLDVVGNEPHTCPGIEWGPLVSGARGCGTVRCPACRTALPTQISPPASQHLPRMGPPGTVVRPFPPPPPQVPSTLCLMGDP